MCQPTLTSLDEVNPLKVRIGGGGARRDSQPPFSHSPEGIGGGGAGREAKRPQQEVTRGGCICTLPL